MEQDDEKRQGKSKGVVICGAGRRPDYWRGDYEFDGEWCIINDEVTHREIRVPRWDVVRIEEYRPLRPKGERR